MLAGILAANMSALSCGSITYSALFIRTLYQPFVAPKSDKHLLAVGRAVIAVIMAGGIGAALFVGNLLDLFKYFISMPAVFGASIWLGFVWRRLTKWAVIIQAIVCFTIYAVIPNVFQTWDWARTNPAFLVETPPRIVMIETEALNDDVGAGRAGVVGQKLKKPFTVEPSAVFFEKVARIDPQDPASPKIGIGRFQAEIWVLSWTGIDFTRQQSPAPGGEVLFRRAVPVRPAVPSELSHEAGAEGPSRPVLRQDAHGRPTHAGGGRQGGRGGDGPPEKFESRKLWPGSQWEIMKPGKKDYIGFGGTWLLVASSSSCSGSW